MSTKNDPEQYDSPRGRVSGTALHVRPMRDGSGGLYVGISYPVAIGGQGIQDREVVVVLSADAKAELYAWMAVGR